LPGAGLIALAVGAIAFVILDWKRKVEGENERLNPPTVAAKLRKYTVWKVYNHGPTWNVTTWILIQIAKWRHKPTEIDLMYRRLRESYVAENDLLNVQNLDGLREKFRSSAR